MIILADKQGITREGLVHVIESMGCTDYRRVDDKTELVLLLRAHPDSVVILDYTLFDIGDVAELQVLALRFSKALWLLFSEDLSYDFVCRTVQANTQFGIVMKESPLAEIRTAIDYAMHHRRFICQRMAEMLISPPQKMDEVKLTKTEIEILRGIAEGMTTKEIAEKRFSSFHTVNTHRKNIFPQVGREQCPRGHHVCLACRPDRQCRLLHLMSKTAKRRIPASGNVLMRGFFVSVFKCRLLRILPSLLRRWHIHRPCCRICRHSGLWPVASRL